MVLRMVGNLPDDNEPVTFEEVENPGHWSDFTFRPKCKDNKYLGHFTPSGAKVVPENDKEGRESKVHMSFSTMVTHLMKLTRPTT